MVSAVRGEWPNIRTRKKAAADLPKIIIASVASTASGCWTSTIGSNSMPTETKNSTAKAARSGRVSWAARWLELGFVKHHAGKEGAEGKRDIKQLHGAEGDAQRQGQHRQSEQLA